jgi:hypothetical protein
MRPYVKLLKGPPTPKSFEPEIQASIESLPHNVARLEARMRDLILESEPVYVSEATHLSLPCKATANLDCFI